ncbi:MAG TPA: hypothetical protein VK698_20295 [Kofleriaceae bacterium]|nr:hypothetical protein [Kofleriaceae bacterium]
MTEDRTSDPRWAPSEAVLQYLRRDLDLLDSPSAHRRARGIQAAAQQGRYDAVGRLKQLLDDDSPLVCDDLITEVRLCALSALQQLHHAAKLPLLLDPVAIRRPWPVADMRAAYQQAIASLSRTEQHDVHARADEVLAERVQPELDHADDTRAYRVLQELHRVSYERQRPDPQTTLTPLQETIYAEQVAAPRPRPCLRVAFLVHPDATLGWIYRKPGSAPWAHDFSDHPAAREASDALTRILTPGKTEVSEGGAADTVETLRGIAALMDEFATELLLPDGLAV